MAAVLVWHPFDKNGVRNARAALRTLVGDRGRRQAVAEVRCAHGILASDHDTQDGNDGMTQADEFTHSSSDSDVESEDMNTIASDVHVDPDAEEDRSRWGREEVGINDAELCGIAVCTSTV